MLLVQIPVDVTALDARYPDRDDSLIESHLVRYCSKFDPLPAVTIRIEGPSAIVTRGHKYLAVAKRLKRTRVRAVIASPEYDPDVKKFLARDDVEQLNWDKIKTTEASELTPRGWHVFFFERQLSSDERCVFDALIVRLFADFAQDSVIDVQHDESEPAAEVFARTPVESEQWARDCRTALAEFGRTHVRIVSYQGRRFSDAE